MEIKNPYGIEPPNLCPDCRGQRVTHEPTVTVMLKAYRTAPERSALTGHLWRIEEPGVVGKDGEPEITKIPVYYVHEGWCPLLWHVRLTDGETGKTERKG